MPHRSKYEQLPTEAINAATLGIDRATSADIIEMMMNDDRKVLAAVQREKSRIALGVDIIVQALRKGGRVVFVGAGTSGRLGVLESAEMPTTFGTNADLVQAVMAGGKNAFLHSKEGVEDNYEDGARAITRLKPSKKDVVIGVSASGMTPFVRGGLTRARKAGAKIIFVTCDPRTELQTFVDLTISPAVGPEVIAGSTRLKAGTATKLVLNMLTTAAMVRIGKTYGNLMVDLHTTSEKARDRAHRIISMVTGLSDDDADKLLRKARWNVRAAIVMQKTKGSYTQALARLRKSHDSVREAIGEDIEPRLRELLHVEPADTTSANKT
jgi:N-acetylmuramic acid 6-phosphate etherase